MFSGLGRFITGTFCRCTDKLTYNLLACSVEIRIEDLEDVWQGDDLAPGGMASDTEGDLAILPRDSSKNRG
jgi:hypothetical protein